jgi:hypothetical protein
MKKFSSLTLLLMITLLNSACGAPSAPATPTVNAVDIQNTVIAAALTVVAETQAAIPTATPPPPTATFTDTPAPTDTLLPLPTLEETFTSVPSGNSGGDDSCVNQALPATLQGETVKIRIHNSTKATLALSVYLSQTTPQIVCGYRTYTITPEQPLVINDLVEGCYTLWAWNPDPDAYFIVTNGASSCIDSSDIAVFDISTSSIKPGT